MVHHTTTIYDLLSFSTFSICFLAAEFSACKSWYNLHRDGFDPSSILIIWSINLSGCTRLDSSDWSTDLSSCVVYLILSVVFLFRLHLSMDLFWMSQNLDFGWRFLTQRVTKYFLIRSCHFNKRDFPYSFYWRLNRPLGTNHLYCTFDEANWWSKLYKLRHLQYDVIRTVEHVPNCVVDTRSSSRRFVNKHLSCHLISICYEFLNDKNLVFQLEEMLAPIHEQFWCYVLVTYNFFQNLNRVIV